MAEAFGWRMSDTGLHDLLGHRKSVAILTSSILPSSTIELLALRPLALACCEDPSYLLDFKSTALFTDLKDLGH